MLKLDEIIGMMEEWAPGDLAEDWDNVGFQIGDYNKGVSRILLALDMDHRLVEKAIREDFHLIITHHPFIFSGLKRVNSLDYDGRLIMDLIKNDILAFNAHTNLDQAIGGVNDELAKIFQLKNSKTIVRTREDDKIGYGRVGDIDPIKLGDYIGLVKSRLGVERLTVFGNVEREITRLAVIGGSGSSFIRDVAKTGADLLITGDIKYHDGQEAEKLGLSIIDPGHFHTEKVILPIIRERLIGLKPDDKDLYVEIYKNPSPIYKIY